MYILGLNIGHNATATLLKDGKIVVCVSEERFSRVKNHTGIPLKAIKYILEDQKIRLQEIAYVVLDYGFANFDNKDFTKHFMDSYTKKSRYNRMVSNLAYQFPNLFNKYYSFREAIKNLNKNKRNKKFIQEMAGILKISPDKILTSNHHLLHALSTCFNLTDEKWLIFTLDGEGSGLCATLNVWDGKNLKVISKSRKIASLGYLYSLATLHLGMKPNQHEFKVMGLAPYAKKDKVDELYNSKFKDLIKINEKLEFKAKFNMAFSDIFFEKEMKFNRFDNIAGAVQKLTEELTEEWVKRAMKKTGIHNIALSGGVFMNVKVNQKILELPEVKKLFVMPSCGDESNAIGACLYGYKKYCEENKVEFKPKPIEDLYLGPEYDNKYIENMIKRDNLHKKYIIKRVTNINKEVAKLLSKGEIVARCSGKSEWGARALGNRSIISNASDTNTIRILNETIKDRDFWMPFTPSIIDKFEKKYVINPKNMLAPYMCITFNSTPLARKDIPAAMHPYDQTLRPQIVTKEYNKDYYEIIEEFSKLTGKGGVLNTSFNLHGEPNVLTPEDAIHTVENSDLKYLAAEDYLFEKK